MQFNRLVSVFSIPSFSLLFTCMVLQGIAVSLTMPFMSLYFTEILGVSIQVFGLFLAMTLIAGIGVNVLLGKRSDMGMNRKYIYLFAVLCNAIVYTGYLLIEDIRLLFVYMIIFTSLAAPGMSQLFAIAREAISQSHYSNPSYANSTLRSGFSLGFILGPLVGSILIRYIGLKGIFIGSIAVVILVAVLVSFFLKVKTIVHGANQQATIKAFKLQQHPSIMLAFIILILMFMAHWMSSLNTALYITHQLGGDTSDVGLISSICAALEIPFMLMLGALAAKYSNRMIMLCGALLGILYYAIVIISIDMWQLIAAQLLLAILVAIISATGISYIQDMLPQMPGYASTLYSNSSTIGRLLGSLLGGVIAGLVGYRYSFVFCLILMVIATLLIMYSKKFVK